MGERHFGNAAVADCERELAQVADENAVLDVDSFGDNLVLRRDNCGLRASNCDRQVEIFAEGQRMPRQCFSGTIGWLRPTRLLR